MSSFINKAKDKITEALDKNSNKDNTVGSDNYGSDNYGTHSSNLSNKADPRIDSDRDNRNDPTSRVGGYGNTETYDQYGDTRRAGGVTTSDTYRSRVGDADYDNARSSNTGPHSSNLLNKVDPRNDSDRDGRNDPASRIGGVGNTQQYGDDYRQGGGVGGFGSTGTTHDRITDSNEPGYGGHSGTHHSHTGATSGLAANTTTGYSGAGVDDYTGTTGTYDNSRSTNTGQHKSNLLNKLDPRSDTDNDYRNDPTSRVEGYGGQTDKVSGYDSRHAGTTGVGAGGYTEQSSTYNDRNDPTSRIGGYETGTTGTTGGYGDVRTDTSGYNTTQHQTTNRGHNDSSYTPGSGDTDQTAGPHNSNILNKLDPRVDSDLDGSKTYGGQSTYR